MHFGIGILGATGYIGTPYRNEIRSSGWDASIVAVCARRPGPLHEAAKLDGARLATHDWREVVEHPDVNLVMILTPDALHYDAFLASAELNKHIFCEKPLGVNSQQARAMFQLVQQKELRNFVPFWTRYVPLFRRAREIIRAGTLGEVKVVIYRWHNPRPLAMPFTWRDDAALSASGSIADVGSHAYDLLRFLLDDEAESVLTHAETVMPPKPACGELNLQEALEHGSSSNSESKTAEERRSATTPDYAQMGVRFRQGTIGSIIVSHAAYVRKGMAPELEIHGSLASLAVDRIKGELFLADSPEPARQYESIQDDGFCNRFENYVFPALERPSREQRNDEHPRVYDGWRVQQFTDAAAESARSGQWVNLSPESTPFVSNPSSGDRHDR